MSGREAFIQAIAAAPADDLPRLVFADWLDEHGEPDRADFIRTQIRWHHALPDERKQLDARAANLFRDHWQRWFGPFVLALDPNADLAHWYEHTPSGGGGGWLDLTTRRTIRAGTTPTVRRVDVCRGFVQRMQINVDSWGERASLAEAFRLESPHQLACDNGLHSPDWVKFTDPVLRRVSDVSLFQHWAWDMSAPESTALLEDPHLAGVRTFGLYTNPPLEGRTNALPVAWMERFVRSSLAYRLNGLSLSRVQAGGTLPLCRPGRLKLENLFLRGDLSTDDVRRLGASELGQTVTELSLQANFGDAAAAALTRDEWPKLRELDLGHNQMTAAVLPALAAAEFTPRLAKLDLSGNPLFTGDERDMARLQELAEALDPDRLEHLDLTDTGLSHVPDFLAARFGDRVTV